MTLRWFLLFFLVWSLLVASVNYIVDPLQFYRKSDDPVFVQNQRYQIPGLVNNYAFDTIFVGTSHSENFIAGYFDKLTGNQSINLAISGSSSWEQKEVVRMAAEVPSLKTVVWELNYKSFAGFNPNLLSTGKFPSYLFEPNITTPFYYLYSIDTLWLSAKNILGQGSKVLNGLHAWGAKEASKFDGKHVVKHYCQRQHEGAGIKRLLPDYQQFIQQQLLALVIQYPDVTFKLFFPPLSIFNFALADEMQRYNAFRRVVYSQTSAFDNIELYDFTLDYDLLSRPQNYKDIEHYNTDISNQIMAVVGAGNQSKLAKSVDLELSQFKKFIKHWRSQEHYCEQ